MSGADARSHRPAGLDRRLQTAVDLVDHYPRATLTVLVGADHALPRKKPEPLAGSCRTDLIVRIQTTAQGGQRRLGLALGTVSVEDPAATKISCMEVL